MSEFQDYLSPATKDTGGVAEQGGQFRIVLANLSIEQLVPWCTKVRVQGKGSRAAWCTLASSHARTNDCPSTTP